MSDAARRVVVTGAAGLLGRLAAAHLERRGRVEVVRLDRHDGGDPRVHVADLAVADPAWAARFAGADAVLHLAAEASIEAPWDRVLRDNVVATSRVVDAALAAGVRRIVYASTSWVMAAHRDRAGPIRCDLQVQPERAYGFGKAFGESLLRAAARRGALSAVVLRIGCVLSDDRDPRELDPWHRRMWLGHRDWCEVVERALGRPAIGFAVVHAMSRNHDSRWSASEARDLLGFVPREGLGRSGAPVARNVLRRLLRRRG